MSSVRPSLDQVIDMVERLPPAERSELRRRLDALSELEPPNPWLARHRELGARLGRCPRPLSDDIIADRADRI